MASVSSGRPAADGTPRYVVNYRDPEGRQRRKTFRRKAEALAFRNTVEADKLRGTYLDVDAGRVSFRAYADAWLASRTFSPLTYEATELRLRLHVLPVIGNLELRHIKPSTIQTLLRSMDLAETYRRVIFSNVSSIFSAAVDDDLIAKNPCKASSVTRPATSRRKVVPWPAEWVVAMHDALPGTSIADVLEQVLEADVEDLAASLDEAAHQPTGTGPGTVGPTAESPGAAARRRLTTRAPLPRAVTDAPSRGVGL